MSARKFNIHKAKRYGNVTVEFELIKHEIAIKILLHNSLIMTIFGLSRRFVMSDAGWPTLTTKTALNTALKQFKPEAYVKQVKGEWLYCIGDDCIPFLNNQMHGF